MGQVIITRRGGGSDLAIKIVGGTIQPSGVAGMLWVNTAIAISKWTAAVAQPSSPAAGDVWIQTDAASTNIINLLKKDNTVVKINVLWVKQYNGTAWVAVAAYYYATAWTQISAATFDPATDYTYTGTSQVVDDGNGHWRIKFLTSGTLRFAVAPDSLDAFLVGGGGGCGTGGAILGAGAGGRTKTATSLAVQAGTNYVIAVGAGGAANGGAGGTTTGLSQSAAGGGCGYGDNHGGDGGSGGGGGSSAETGGNGGTNGGNGSSQYGNKSGVGQGTTTYEFGNPTLTLYGGGGGGGSNGVGGAGGGASKGARAAANTGGGGGGSGGRGGSGIVVIRDHRTT